jgi:ethanolamine ammonia-lyase large subunit
MYLKPGRNGAVSQRAPRVDQQTCEARYAVARQFKPLLVNTVVGFIGPGICDVKQIIRAGLEDHFAGSCWGCPWAATCATPTTPRTDQNDMDVLTLLGRGWLYLDGHSETDDHVELPDHVVS